MCRVKNSGKVHTAADTIDRPVLFVAHVRYGLSSNRAKLLVVLKWSVSIVTNISSFGSHLWDIYIVGHLFVGHRCPNPFGTGIQLAWYQPSCRPSAPTLCICPPSVDHTAVAGNSAAAITLQSWPPELRSWGR